MLSVTSKSFFQSWLDAVQSRETELQSAWDGATPYTDRILNSDDSVAADVAITLGLKHYSEYYSMDAVMFDPEQDKINGCAPDQETWLCNVRIAIEHENEFFSGLYKEVGHLLLIDCDLRVLITYPPANHSGVEPELTRLAAIIEQSGKADVISINDSFLLIFGSKLKDDKRIRWSAQSFRYGKWVELNNQ